MSPAVIARTTLSKGNDSIPTVLAAELDSEYRDRLIGGLRNRGYIVLEAREPGEALDRVKTHSRHIHLLLVNGDPNGRNLAATLKLYRPNMEVILVSENESGTAPDLLSPNLVLEKVQGLVKVAYAARAGA